MSLPIEPDARPMTGDVGQTTTRALVVDDHPITLQGCKMILEDMGISQVDAAPTLRTGYRLCLRLRPDLAIVDLTLRDDDLTGLSLIQRIAARRPRTGLIAFSMHDDPTIVSRALAGGALSYVLKDARSEELAAAVRHVLVGKAYLSHALAMKVAMLQARRDPSGIAALTEREAEILALLGQGNSYDKIAGKLGISIKTVTNSTSLMRAKLKLTSLAELIRLAMKRDEPGL